MDYWKLFTTDDVNKQWFGHELQYNLNTITVRVIRRNKIRYTFFIAIQIFICFIFQQDVVLNSSVNFYELMSSIYIFIRFPIQSIIIIIITWSNFIIIMIIY